MDNKQKIARDSIFKESKEAEGLNVKGYDFNSGIDYDKLFDSYLTTGAQATNLARAIEIINKMRKENAFIYLGYTSNMITTGIREIIRYLAEHKMIDMLVTTGGGMEEDFIQ